MVSHIKKKDGRGADKAGLQGSGEASGLVGCIARHGQRRAGQVLGGLSINGRRKRRSSAQQRLAVFRLVFTIP